MNDINDFCFQWLTSKRSMKSFIAALSPVRYFDVVAGIVYEKDSSEGMREKGVCSIKVQRLWDSPRNSEVVRCSFSQLEVEAFAAPEFGRLCRRFHSAEGPAG